MAGMSWHVPKDDAWKQAHLAMLVRLGKRAWLHCDDCRHSVMAELRRKCETALTARRLEHALHYRSATMISCETHVPAQVE
jgi:hypothetical protein